MEPRAIALLLAAWAALAIPAPGRGLVVDAFESGDLSIENGCPALPGGTPSETQTGLSDVVLGQRRIALDPQGGLPAPCGSSTNTHVTAAVTTGAGDDGLLFSVVKGVADPGGSLVYGVIGPEIFDLTDGGSSDTLQISFARVEGPIRLTIIGTADEGGAFPIGSTRVGVDAPGTLAIAIDALFRDQCLLDCPDPARLEQLVFQFNASAPEWQVEISDIRTVPEPTTAVLLFTGLLSLARRRRLA